MLWYHPGTIVERAILWAVQCIHTATCGLSALHRLSFSDTQHRLILYRDCVLTHHSVILPAWLCRLGSHKPLMHSVHLYHGRWLCMAVGREWLCACCASAMLPGEFLAHVNTFWLLWWAPVKVEQPTNSTQQQGARLLSFCRLCAMRCVVVYLGIVLGQVFQ